MSTLKEKIVEAKRRLELMEAADCGAEMQYKVIGGNDGWTDKEGGEPLFEWGRVDYRLKPQPKEIWVNEYDDGDADMYLHTEKKTAESFLRKGRTTTHYREVIE